MDIYKNLKTGVLHTNFMWATFRDVFATSEETIDLLANSGVNFFSATQNLFLQDIIESLLLLSGSDNNHEYSLEQLVFLARQNGNTVMGDELATNFNRISDLSETSFAPFRTGRIAHVDMKRSLNKDQTNLFDAVYLPIQVILAMINDYMNMYEAGNHMPHTSYANIFTQPKFCGEVLIRSLQLARTVEFVLEECQKNGMEAEDTQIIEH